MSRRFAKRARRATVAHPKLTFFDAGVFRALRPQGPLDADADIDGQALEILVHQELRATVDSLQKAYDIYFWRTRAGDEVDFVLYGKDGFKAFEVTRASRLRGRDFHGLSAFAEEYPEAERYLLYGGNRAAVENDVNVLPVDVALRTLGTIL